MWNSIYNCEDLVIHIGKQLYGNEIDLLTKTAERFNIFEIKSTSTISYKLIDGMNFFDKITNGRVRAKPLFTVAMPPRRGANSRFETRN